MTVLLPIREIWKRKKTCSEFSTFFALHRSKTWILLHSEMDLIIWSFLQHSSRFGLLHLWLFKIFNKTFVFLIFIPPYNFSWESCWMMVRIKHPKVLCTCTETSLLLETGRSLLLDILCLSLYHLTPLKLTFKAETGNLHPLELTEAPLLKSNLSYRFFLRNKALLCAKLLLGTLWMFAGLLFSNCFILSVCGWCCHCSQVHSQSSHPLLTWCHWLEIWTRAVCVTLRDLSSAGHLET